MKVVTAQEMSRIEGLAYAEGASEVAFMENAGTAIAQIAYDYLTKKGCDKSVALLVGKGNNGGDAYVAGAKLLEKGVSVRAYHFYSLDLCGPLCKQQHERFKNAGGQVIFFHRAEEVLFAPCSVILDGLVGTGFHGKAEGILEVAIEKANASRIPIIAIDIPSGLNGNTGEIGSVAIRACQTISLGLPKIGFFLGEGWNHIGELVHADFGLGAKFIEEAKEEAHLLDEKKLTSLLPPIKRNRHKYEAGYVLAWGGSPGMPGAALLATLATLRSGAGMVRLFYPQEMEMELSAAPMELLREPWNGEKILQESGRARAMLIGPGIGRTKEVKKALKWLLLRLHIPCVLDADALYLLSENLSWSLPDHCVVTPHRQEMQRLLSKEEKVTLATCQKFAEEKDVTVVLKGGPTFVFHPQTKPVIVPYGDPGMATAGAGDVLTGVIAALLAQQLDAHTAALLGVALHGIAGQCAAAEKTSYCMIASDIIAALPKAFSLTQNYFGVRRPGGAEETLDKSRPYGL